MVGQTITFLVIFIKKQIFEKIVGQVACRAIHQIKQIALRRAKVQKGANRAIVERGQI